MSQDDRNDASSRPVLVGLEEEPDGLSEAWRALFSACWDWYEVLQQRRQAAANHTSIETDNNNGAQECAR